MLIDRVGATLPNTNSRTARSTHSPALVQSLISSHGRVTSWPWERDCVDALMFMFGRLAMMKECLFKSGLEGPLLNAPPFSPYARTHAHPSLLRTHIHTLMRVCVRTYIYTCRGICNFVINPPHLVLYSRHLFTSLQDCRNTAFKSTPDSVIQSSLRVQDLTHTVWESCTTLHPHQTSMNNSHCSALSVCGLFSLWFSSSSSRSLLQACAWPSLLFLHLISLWCHGLYCDSVHLWGFSCPCSETSPVLSIFLVNRRSYEV